MKPRSACLAVIGGICFCLHFAVRGTAADVAVVLSSAAQPYQEALQGFQNKTGLEIEVHDIGDDLETGHRLMENLSAKEIRAVLTIGTKATLAGGKLPSSIPLIYTMVINEMQLPRSSVGGVLIRVGVKTQFELLRRLLPEARRIGVIYNPRYTKDDILEARTVAETFDLELIPVAVENEEQAKSAVAKLTPERVDLIWTVVDKTVLQPVVMSALISHSWEQKLPLIGLSEAHVRSGAFAAFHVTYPDVGQQAADQVRSILEGAQPRMETPEQVIVFVNAEVQKKLGLGDLPPLPGIQYIR